MQPKRTPEQYADDLIALERDADAALKAGEIDKPDYDTLKYRVERALENVCEVIAKKHLYGKGGAIYDLAKWGRDEKRWSAVVSCAHTHYVRDVLSAEKKLAAIRETNLREHVLFKDIAEFVAKYKGIAVKVIELKSKTVSAVKRREQKAERAEQARKAKFTEYKTLVDVLQQHIDDYVKQAGKMAVEDFDAWMVQIEKCGWSLDRVAPAGESTDQYELRVFKDRRRTLFLSITEPASETDRITRKFSIELKAEYVEREKDAAHEDYMAWIYKMIQKIGQPVDAAEMNGDPWIQSIVSVTCRDGSKQTWHTQMIINRSKYDRAFHQFPSRRVDK